MAVHTHNATDFKLTSFKGQVMGPRDVEVKVQFCGICHSDLHTARSEWGKVAGLPLVVGHEIVGTVSRMGSDVKNLKLGQLVGVGAQHGSCITCDTCKAKRHNLCDGMILTYNSRLPPVYGKYVTMGGYATYHVADCDFTIPVPEGLDPKVVAPLFCAGVTVFAPMRRYSTHVGPGKRVGIVGIGGLGHLGVQFARALGATVVAISSSPSKEKEAKELGAHEFISSQDPTNLVVAESTLDFLLFTASVDADWDLYAHMLRKEGVFCIVGAPPSKVSFDVFTLIRGQISVCGSIIGSPEDIRQMLDVAIKHKVMPKIEVMPMSQTNKAVQRVLANEVRHRMVLTNDIDK